MRTALASMIARDRWGREMWDQRDWSKSHTPVSCAACQRAAGRSVERRRSDSNRLLELAAARKRANFLVAFQKIAAQAKLGCPPRLGLNPSSRCEKLLKLDARMTKFAQTFR
jgi:hypothetical protein